MRAKIQAAIEEYTVQLGELWDKCLVPQYERDEFFSNLRARKFKINLSMIDSLDFD
jgi:hypothetical protein